MTTFLYTSEVPEWKEFIYLWENVLYVENVVIKTLAWTFVEEMFENKIPWKKWAGICLFECFLELVNIVEKSQSSSKVCRWHRADHTTAWEGRMETWPWSCCWAPGVRGAEESPRFVEHFGSELNIFEHATLTASVTFFSNQLKAQNHCFKLNIFQFPYLKTCKLQPPSHDYWLPNLYLFLQLYLFWYLEFLNFCKVDFL